MKCPIIDLTDLQYTIEISSAKKVCNWTAQIVVSEDVNNKDLGANLRGLLGEGVLYIPLNALENTDLLYWNQVVRQAVRLEIFKTTCRCGFYDPSIVKTFGECICPKPEVTWCP